MTERFDVIVVGGGIVGASIAYHVAVETRRSVCLLERDRLTSGTTWHAAGLVAELRASANLTRLARYSGELYERLEAEGEPTGFKRVGALTLAAEPARSFELQKLAAMGRANGVDCRWLAAAEIRERWPAINAEDLEGGVYMPRDGQTSPVDTTLALARQATRAGARVREDARVEALIVDSGRVTGVELENESLHADQVVLASGLWTRDLAGAAGAAVPLYPAEHFYAVTEPTDLGELPIVRVPDDGIYLKPDAGRMLIGCFERTAKPIAAADLPDQPFVELPFDTDHFLPYLQAGLARVPELAEIGIRTWFNGPESFTPDGRYILGPTPEVEGLYVAAGFNSIGIQSAGGVGRAMARWLADDAPPMDLWDVDIRRFLPHHNETQFLRGRTAESLGLLYAMHWPFHQYERGRDVHRSPLHERIAARRACFGEVAGWERPNWYASDSRTPEYRYTYGRPDWFDDAARECRAVREDVALFDQSSFAKYRVSGPDARRFLDRLCTANMAVPIDRIVYCQWLNPRGGIEADVTVTRIDDDEYWVVSAAASRTRDLAWLGRHRAGFDVTITDITFDYAVIGIMGPNARRVLGGRSEAGEARWSNPVLPFSHSARLDIAGVPIRAQRITYVGALGYELYIERQHALAVYDALSDLTHAGYHALDSLRMEKAYRHWGHDITDEDTPLEAGLSFTVDWEKPEGFIGREALTESKSSGVNKRLVAFRLRDAKALLTHDEPIWRDGEIVGCVASAAFSHTFDRSLCLGYVAVAPGAPRTDVLNGEYAIEIGPEKFPADASLRPFYDPDNLEIKL